MPADRYLPIYLTILLLISCKHILRQHNLHIPLHTTSYHHSLQYHNINSLLHSVSLGFQILTMPPKNISFGALPSAPPVDPRTLTTGRLNALSHAATHAPTVGTGQDVLDAAQEQGNEIARETTLTPTRRQAMSLDHASSQESSEIARVTPYTPPRRQSANLWDQMNDDIIEPSWEPAYTRRSTKHGESSTSAPNSRGGSDQSGMISHGASSVGAAAQTSTTSSWTPAHQGRSSAGSADIYRNRIWDETTDDQQSRDSTPPSSSHSKTGSFECQGLSDVAKGKRPAEFHENGRSEEMDGQRATYTEEEGVSPRTERQGYIERDGPSEVSKGKQPVKSILQTPAPNAIQQTSEDHHEHQFTSITSHPVRSDSVTLNCVIIQEAITDHPKIDWWLSGDGAGNRPVTDVEEMALSCGSQGNKYRHLEDIVKYLPNCRKGLVRYHICFMNMVQTAHLEPSITTTQRTNFEAPPIRLSRAKIDTDWNDDLLRDAMRRYVNR